jgi:hypothetical protein
MKFLFLVLSMLLLGACEKDTSISPVTESIEAVTVDFEPGPNLVQTLPYHIQKQNAHDAFISVKLENNQLHFWSDEVSIIEFVELDAYTSDWNSNFDSDTLVVTFSNLEELQNELDLQEQLISVLNVEL